ncbi:MAG: FKBP-type peptidyl-prolyl cis-trans isomerase [Nocardioides sp.]
MRRTPSAALSSSALSRRLGTAAAALLLGTSLAACGNESDTDAGSTTGGDTPSATASGSTEESSSDLPDWAPEILTDDDGAVTGLDVSDIAPVSDELLVEEVTTGDGAPVEAGQSITANYFGQLTDADEPFDESFSGSPFTAPIGVGSLIPGWDEGLVGVPVGSRVIMSIPPDLAYGDQGAGDAIPPGSTLFFVVDIIEAA